MIDLDAVRRSVAETNPFPSSDPISPAMQARIVSRIEKTLQIESGAAADHTRRRTSAKRRHQSATTEYGPAVAAGAGGIGTLHRRPIIVAVAAGLAVIAVFTVPALLGHWLRTDLEAPTVVPTTVSTPTTVVTPSTTVVPTTTTVPRVAGLPITWERVPHDPMFVDAWISDAATNDKRVVAVGSAETPQSDPTAGVVWVTDDGWIWERIDDPSFTETFVDGPPPWWVVGMYSVDYARDLFVAAGSMGNDAAIWVSPDGIEWSRIEAPDLGGDGLEVILSLTASEAGWVAVGQNDLDAGVWFSPDGRTWQTVDDPDLKAGDEIVSALLFDVVEGGPGFVGVGWVQVKDSGGGTGFRAEQQEQAAVWVSVDGQDWTLTDIDQFGDEYVIDSVAVDPLGSGLIAFGWDGIWRSSDGVHWSLSNEQNAQLSAVPLPGSSIAGFGGGVVAAGSDTALSLWTSADGRTTWVRHDQDDPAFDGYRPAITKLLRYNDTVIAFGTAGEYLNEVSAVWIGH